MKFGVPWSVKGIRPEARETAREAARRSGMSLGDWLNTVILHQASQSGMQAPGVHDDEDDEIYGEEMSSVHQRLDDLTRKIDQFARSGPQAYAPKRARNENDQLTELIGRLDRRIEQFVATAQALPHVAPPVGAYAPQAYAPHGGGQPSLDRAIAEISARQRSLNGAPQAAAATAAPLPQVLQPVPAQNLSGLEDQLRRITDQIETLRKPGVEEAINALRGELGEIGRALNEAMPRRAIDTIEKQIQGLSQRITEGRHNGVDGGQLASVEHALAEVRDALRGLTPAENLVGFNEAVHGLAHKIDLIVAQKDPAMLGQLEHAITTLRDMSQHVASNEAVGELAAQVHMLGQRVEHLSAMSGGDALNHLESRIEALSRALAERAQNGGTVPPRLEALVQSLSDKIEQVQQRRGENVAVDHLENTIVKLVERLDASDSRLSHLESIERGLADLLVHIEDMRSNKQTEGLRADNSPSVDALKQDLARTQNALEAVNGTLGHVVDRLANIEKDIRGDRRHAPPPDDPLELNHPAAGKVAVRFVDDAPPTAPRMPPAAQLQVPPQPQPSQPQRVAPPVHHAPVQPTQPAQPAQPRRMPPAGHMPIDPNMPPDQPLEPGSGPPRVRPGAKIVAGHGTPATPRPAAAAPAPAPTKAGFIAAARRAAQSAVEGAVSHLPQATISAYDEENDETPASPRGGLMKRIKALLIAGSIVAGVIGAVQILGNMVQRTPDLPAKTSQTDSAPADSTEDDDGPTTNRPSANPLAPSQPLGPIAPAPAGAPSIAPPMNLNGSSLNPSLLAPPVLSAPQTADVTGAISRSPRTPAVPAPAPSEQTDAAPAIYGDKLPIAIGGPRLRSAALAGDRSAAYEIAVRFAEGRGVPTSLEDAARWYERASSKGLVLAQFRYASLLEKGQGVRKDLAQARKLYMAAAAKGNAKAMHNLAVLYAEGIDGRPDYATAAQWFTKAANFGVADSQYNLGVLAARGLGVTKNPAESYKWFALAAAQGDKEAARKRDEIASQLDARSLTTAQQAVSSFVPDKQPAEAVLVPEPQGGWDNAAATPPSSKRSAGPLSVGALTKR